MIYSACTLVLCHNTPAFSPGRVLALTAQGVGVVSSAVSDASILANANAGKN